MSKVWQTCHVLPCLHWHQIFLSIHQAVILSLKSLVGMGPVSLRRQIILSVMSCVLVRNSHLKFSNVVTNGSRRGGYQHTNLQKQKSQMRRGCAGLTPAGKMITANGNVSLSLQTGSSLVAAVCTKCVYTHSTISYHQMTV